MELRVGDFLIRSDNVCFTLFEIHVVKAKEEGAKGIAPKPENIGKEREANPRYYGTLKAALCALADRMTASSEEQLGVQELLGVLKGIQATIAGVVDEVNYPGSETESGV